MSFLHSDFIPIEILNKKFSNETLQNCIKTFENLSLIHSCFKLGDYGLKIHAIIQEEIIYFMNLNFMPSENLVLELIDVLNDLMPDVNDFHDKSWRLSHTYYQHANKLFVYC